MILAFIFRCHLHKLALCHQQVETFLNTLKQKRWGSRWSSWWTRELWPVIKSAIRSQKIIDIFGKNIGDILKPFIWGLVFAFSNQLKEFCELNGFYFEVNHKFQWMKTLLLHQKMIKNNERLPLERFVEVKEKYRVTGANKYVRIKMQLSRSSQVEIPSCWAEDAVHSRRLPSFQTVNVFPLLPPTFLSRALVADLPPDLLQNPLLKLVTEMKQM